MMGTTFKKSIAILLGLSMLLVLFMANIGASAEEKVNIRFMYEAPWVDHPSIMKLQAVIEEKFNPTHPNIEVTLMPLFNATQNEQVIKQAISGSNDFDVACVSYAGVGITAASGSLMDLTGKVDDVNASVFGSLLDLCTYKGQQYIVPWWQDCRVLGVNKNMFEDAGLQYPTTLEEMANAAKAFKEKGMNGFVTPGSIDAIIPCEWQILLTNNGGRIVNDVDGEPVGGLDTPEGVEWMEMMQILYDSMPNDGIAYEWGAYAAALGSGGAAMGFAVPGFLDNEQFNYEGGPTIEWIVTPAGRAGSTSLVGGYGLGVVSTTKYPDEALTFLKFLLEPEVNATCLIDLPVVMDSYQYAPFNSDMYDVFFEQFKTAGPYYVNVLSRDGQVTQALYPVMTEGLINRTPAEELAKKCNDAVNRAIGE